MYRDLNRTGGKYYEEVKYKGKNRNNKVIFSFLPPSHKLVFQLNNNQFLGNSCSKGVFQLINYISNGFFSDNKVEEIAFHNHIDRNRLYKRYDSFTTNIVIDMFETIEMFEKTSHIIGRYKKSIGKKEKPLNVLVGSKDAFVELNIKVAKKIFYFICDQKAPVTNVRNNFIIELIKEQSASYTSIRTEMIENVVNYYSKNGFARKNYLNNSKIVKYSDILNKLSHPSLVSVALSRYLTSFLKESYSSIKPQISHIEIIAVTMSAIYTMFDLCSISCTPLQLDNGIDVEVSRDNLFPHQSWWDLFSKTDGRFNPKYL